MKQRPAPLSLHARDGRRKYATPDERARFIAVAAAWPDEPIGTLCLLIAYAGCRVSEALAVTSMNIDTTRFCVTIRCLKKRGMVVFRDVPLPDEIMVRIVALMPEGDARLWPISRTTAWRRIKSVMVAAEICEGPHRCPKGLRHGFGIHAVRCNVPLNLVQRWLGHARLSTTAIYTDAMGDEERALAALMWR